MKLERINSQNQIKTFSHPLQSARNEKVQVIATRDLQHPDDFKKAHSKPLRGRLSDGVKSGYPVIPVIIALAVLGGLALLASLFALCCRCCCREEVDEEEMLYRGYH